MAKSKDLFDDTTMSFGEHLEVLRVHVVKALIGLTIAVLLALLFGDTVVAIIRRPIDRALQKQGQPVQDDIGDFDFWGQMKSTFGFGEDDETDAPQDPEQPYNDTIVVQLKASELAGVLHELDPENYPEPPEPDGEQLVPISISAPEFAVFNKTADDANKPVTLNVQEAFLTYLKVSFIAGLILASPWVFFQIWQFVAAGLYPHERRYVHIYLPMSLGLFVGGAAFCFTMVFPFVLDFLLGFNKWLGVDANIRLSEWVSFAILLPVMFGVSFQLPLVMLFLERISIFDVDDYREKRRLAVLVIAILSMLLTPADPMSMLLMMFPLLGLYELGILLCGMRRKSHSPFDEPDD